MYFLEMARFIFNILPTQICITSSFVLIILSLNFLDRLVAYTQIILFKLKILRVIQHMLKILKFKISTHLVYDFEYYMLTSTRYDWHILQSNLNNYLCFSWNTHLLYLNLGNSVQFSLILHCNSNYICSSALSSDCSEIHKFRTVSYNFENFTTRFLRFGVLELISFKQTKHVMTP